MTQPATLAAGPTVHELKELQCELYRLCNEREAALLSSAGAHALAYVVSPADTGSQHAALADKYCMDGLLMAKERYIGEVRHFDGDGDALLARCLSMFASLADYEHKEAESAALKVVHLDADHADYRKASLEVTRHLRRESGIQAFGTMFRTAFGRFIGRAQQPVATPAATS